MSNAKTTDVLMDAIAVAGKVSGATGGIIAGIDTAIQADLSNDKDLLLAASSLRFARDLVDPNSGAYIAIRTAENHLATAMEKDFADMTKENLKAAVLPYQGKVDEAIDGFKALIRRVREKAHPSHPPVADHDRVQP